MGGTQCLVGPPALECDHIHADGSILQECEGNIGLPPASVFGPEVISTGLPDPFGCGAPTATHRFVRVEAQDGRRVLQKVLSCETTILEIKRLVLQSEGIPLAKQRLAVDSIVLDNTCDVSGADVARRITSPGQGATRGAGPDGVSGDPLVLSLIVRTGPFAVSGGLDGHVKLWDLGTGQCIQHLQEGPTVLCLAVDWAAQSVLLGSTRLHLWKLATGPHEPFQSSSKITSQEVHSVAVSVAARRCISGHDDGSIQVWQIDEELKHLSTIQAHNRRVMCVSVDWAEERAVCASKDGTLRIVDLRAGEAVRQLQAHSSWVQCMDVCWPSQQALSGGADTMLRLWDLSSGQMLLELAGHTSIVQCLSVCWQSKRAASGSIDRTLRIWDLDTGQLLRSYGRGDEWPNCLAVDWASMRAVSGAGGGRLQLWSLAVPEGNEEAADVIKVEEEAPVQGLESAAALRSAHHRSVICLSVNWSTDALAAPTKSIVEDGPLRYKDVGGASVVQALRPVLALGSHDEPPHPRAVARGPNVVERLRGAQQGPARVRHFEGPGSAPLTEI